MPNAKNLKFSGQYRHLFFINIKNLILILLSLSLYLPWAFVAVIKFFCSNTAYKGKYFEYTGTVKEAIIGYLKFLVLGLLYALLSTLCIGEGILQICAIIILAFFVIFRQPVYIFNLCTYLLSRIKYDGKPFNTDLADKKEFVFLWIKGILFGVLTLGLNFLCFPNMILSYVINHTSFGSKRFYYGAGNVNFFKSLILENSVYLMLTFGLYLPWVFSSGCLFFVNNTRFNGRKLSLSLSKSSTIKLFFISGFLPVLISIVPIPTSQGFLMGLFYLLCSIFVKSFLDAYGTTYFLKTMTSHVLTDEYS